MQNNPNQKSKMILIKNPTSIYKTLDFMGYPNYQIGSDGSVWSKWQMKGRGKGKGAFWFIGKNWKPLKPKRVDAYGHLGVALHLGKPLKPKYESVHRLVLFAFVGPCPKGQQCRHLNGIHFDNRLTNLAWGTPKEDRQDMIRHGNLRYTTFPGEKNYAAKLNNVKVKKLRKMYKTSKYTTYQLAELFQVSPSTTQRVVNRTTWTHI